MSITLLMQAMSWTMLNPKSPRWISPGAARAPQGALGWYYEIRLTDCDAASFPGMAGLGIGVTKCCTSVMRLGLGHGTRWGARLVGWLVGEGFNILTYLTGQWCWCSCLSHMLVNHGFLMFGRLLVNGNCCWLVFSSWYDNRGNSDNEQL